MTGSLVKKFSQGQMIRWVFSLTLFIALSIGVPLGIYHKVDAQSFSVNPQLFSLPVFLSIAALLLIYYTSDALRLHFILKASGYQLKCGNLVKITFMNMLFSNITPLATGGGFAQIWYLRRLRVPIGTATAATTIRTFIAMLLIFLPIPFLVMYLPFFHNNAAMAGAGWILSIVALAYIACFLVMLFRLRWLLRIIDVVAKALVKIQIVSMQSMTRRKAQVLRETVRFSHCLKVYSRGERKYVALSILCTVSFLLSLFSFPFLLLRGSGYDTDYLITTGLVAVQTCLMYFAPSPGGAGFAEGVFSVFFSSLLGASELVGIMLMWRFLTVYLGMLIGIPATLHELNQRGAGND